MLCLPQTGEAVKSTKRHSKTSTKRTTAEFNVTSHVVRVPISSSHEFSCDESQTYVHLLGNGVQNLTSRATDTQSDILSALPGSAEHSLVYNCTKHGAWVHDGRLD